MKDYVSKTEAELKQIAMDLYDGKIFCDRQVSSASDLKMVFMPIALGALSGWAEEDLNNLGMLYEYNSQAGPRSVNGYPCFLSVRMLDKHDAEVMFLQLNQYKALKESFASEKTDQV